MVAQIESLVDKLDNVEIIAAKIGAILVEESAQQSAFAAALPLSAGKDPNDWSLRVYLERSDALSEYLDPEDGNRAEGEDAQNRALLRKTPIVNVWFDKSQIDMKRSNLTERQTYTGIFNIDCHGYGASEETTEGHLPADVVASRAAHRAARLVRNILMSSFYQYLGMQGTVSRRWVESVQTFQPSIDGRSIQSIWGARVALHVDFSEHAPQIAGQTLESVSVGVQRQSDGLLYLQATIPPQ